jgi:hypothetical protein
MHFDPPREYWRRVGYPSSALQTIASPRIHTRFGEQVVANRQIKALIKDQSSACRTHFTVPDFSNPFR